jgi:hypothetical protein
MADEPDESQQVVEDQKTESLSSSGDLAAEATMVDPIDDLALEEYAMRKLGLL